VLLCFSTLNFQPLFAWSRFNTGIVLAPRCCSDMSHTEPNRVDTLLHQSTLLESVLALQNQRRDVQCDSTRVLCSVHITCSPSHTQWSVTVTNSTASFKRATKVPFQTSLYLSRSAMSCITGALACWTKFKLFDHFTYFLFESWKSQ